MLVGSVFEVMKSSADAQPLLVHPCLVNKRNSDSQCAPAPQRAAVFAVITAERYCPLC
jgi:hypothetical protein